MNGDFRSDKYLNRMEYYAYDLETDISSTIRGNDQEQMKNQHRFIIDNTAEINPIDWYNAFFEVEFKLVKLADNTAGFAAADMCTMNNGLSLIKEIRVLSEGESVYNNNISANEGANLLTLLNYTKSYADSVGSDQFFYLDTSTSANINLFRDRTIDVRDATPGGDTRPIPMPRNNANYNEGFTKRKALTDGGLIQNISLPLNLYSYFASFKRNIHPNLKINIEIRLEQDANLIFRNAAEDGKIIVTKLRLWCPKLIFNAEGLNLYRSDYMKPKKWAYLAEYFYKFTRAGDNRGDMVRLVTSIRKPRHVFIWTVPEASYAVQTANIFVFDTNSIGTNNIHFSRAQLVVNNSKYYPELSINANEKTKLYRALMEYNGTYTQDKICGSLINRDNFDKLFGVLYFDLRKQDDDLIDASVTINFNYQLSGAPSAAAIQYRINVLILHENEIELAQVGSKLLVRST